MSAQDAKLVADAVRQRLATVEVACRTIVNTVGAFPDPDAVFRQLAHTRTQIDLARQTLLRSGLLS